MQRKSTDMRAAINTHNGTTTTLATNIDAIVILLAVRLRVCLCVEQTKRFLTLSFFRLYVDLRKQMNETHTLLEEDEKKVGAIHQPWTESLCNIINFCSFVR